MKLTLAFSLLLSCFVATVYAAAEDEVVLALKKDYICQCGAMKYTDGNVGRAIKKAIDGGWGEYPHEFENYPEQFKFANCPTGILDEYPLQKGEDPWNGGDLGEDRVVYQGKGKFCGCITHQGAGPGLFKRCKDL